MPLDPGARLGGYQVLSLIGSGGMGEVYRATDTALKRQVAIKVLPQAVAADPERLARLQREAEVLAALNHPNIAHIHGIERSDTTFALVMELIDGPTLADRILEGPIPIAEALPIAKQIADALEAAHEQSIVHRDLKPANVKIREDGTAKVLDFGLAKALEPAGALAASVSISPTVTTPAMTQVGMILGTAAYMSPEQARAKPVDKRADVWAFGCVLYEMLTGRRAFEGEDVTETLAAVIKEDPDWTALPADLPTPIVALLRSCLAKDRRRRIGDIAAATFVLEHAGGLASRTAGPQPAIVRPPRWRRLGAMFAGSAFAALIAGLIVWIATRPTPPSVVRTSLATAGPAALSVAGNDRDVVITPDGSRIVYRGNGQLLVRALNQLEPTVLTASGFPRGVFVSPDGQWVGFFDNTLLKKVAITGGPSVTIASAGGSAGRGAAWAPDGTIVFAMTALSGLQRVSAAGGTPAPITNVDRQHGQAFHQWPEFLPGGKALLFTILPSGAPLENAQVAVLDLATGVSKVLVNGGSHAHYVPTGHLVYGAGGTLRAVAFDLRRLEVAGTPVPVLEGVVMTPSGGLDASIASNGSLVYVPGAANLAIQNTVVAVDRQGRASPVANLPPDSYRDVRVSPDATRLALATNDDVWIYDLARATLSRLTTDPAPDTRPLWTPDGRRIIFRSDRAAHHELFWRSADGTGVDQRLLSRAVDLTDLRASSWSADNKQLVFTEVTAPGRCVIEQMPFDRPAEVQVLVKDDFCNDFATVSPDGRWLAYHSDRSARSEVYVQRYPELTDRQQISSGGGMHPMWSRDGRELFFVARDNRQIFSVSIQSGAQLVAGRPQLLFEMPMMPPRAGTRPLDLAPDGRFFIIRGAQNETGTGPSNMILVQNWFEELKARVPIK